MHGLFGDDSERQKNINARNERLIKGVDHSTLETGDFITLSHNMSTGDRSYCNDVFEIQYMNEVKSHATLEKVDARKDRWNGGMILLSEHEIYMAEVQE